MGVSKNRGTMVYPQIIHLFIGFSIIFTIHLGGKSAKSPIFFWVDTHIKYYNYHKSNSNPSRSIKPWLFQLAVALPEVMPKIHLWSSIQLGRGNPRGVAQGKKMCLKAWLSSTPKKRIPFLPANMMILYDSKMWAIQRKWWYLSLLSVASRGENHRHKASLFDPGAKNCERMKMNKP